MGVMTLEGVVDNGRIRLREDVCLPDHTEVFVIVPGIRIEGGARLMTPRLAHPEQVREFGLEVDGPKGVWEEHCSAA